ncbi:chemotaxis protein [Viridibacillus sp. YIM B01967]|uniref:Chemotaxis protein n=1 Tax=Viridibacillus soli TaxID=2798301 RepID=A0ABS1HBN7_9BACL|nr:methyl-accepting chemotaxis protein [Viridibacillus soli]MBK3496853.1 chemotaxis protein [Viridibacillus soli]
MSLLEALKQATPYIQMAFNNEICISIVDRKNSQVYFAAPGNKVDMGIKIGDKIQISNDVQAVYAGKTAALDIPAEQFGISLHAKMYPIKEDGRVIGLLNLVFSTENQEKLQSYMENLQNVILGLQDKVHLVASHSEELAATSTEITAQSRQALQDSEASHSVTDFIKSISQQTNLLGLNASIEAARAGQHGAGFNIVAQEVRKLSLETKTATEKIEDSLKNITQNLQGLMGSMSQVNTASNEQAELVQDFSSIIEELGSLSSQMGQLVKETLR